MKMRLLHTIPVFFVFVLSSCTPEPAEPLAETLEVRAENELQLEQELLQIVNDYRISVNTNPLEFNEVAYKYANSHTDYMIGKGTLSHDNFSARASGINAELPLQMIGENVAKDYDTAYDAFVGWLESANHKKTMEGDFTHTAISIKEDSEGNLYFTHLFCKL